MQDAWPHGVIELDGCVVEMETKPEEDKKRKKNKQFIFLISNPSIGSTRFSGMRSFSFLSHECDLGARDNLILLYSFPSLLFLFPSCSSSRFF